MQKIITANDLFSGEVIYLDSHNEWDVNINKSCIFIIQEDAEKAILFANTQIGKIVGPYLVDIENGVDGDLRPVLYRERIRSTGPSNYFHGKQEKKGKNNVRV